MLFDTGGNAFDAAFRLSRWPPRQVMTGLTRSSEERVVPRILFTKGGGLWLEGLAESGADALGIDWQTPLGEARRRVGHRVALQGNMDPMALFGTRTAIEAEAQRILDAYGAGPGHDFNLGHGISQHTDPANVNALVEAVHALSSGAHAR
jgi:uroporphyrinogen decarboxylase